MTTDTLPETGSTPESRPPQPPYLRGLRIFTVSLWILCTLALWLPNPRLLFGGMPIEEAPGFGWSHLLMFAVLTFFVLRTWPAVSPVFWLVVLLAYAFLSELGQIPIPLRTFEWVDIAQDAVGIMFAFLVELIRRVCLGRSHRESDSV